MQPSISPSSQPTTQPSSKPTNQPSSVPSLSPSIQPSSHPSRLPSEQPSARPSAQPSSLPSCQPSSQPSMKPSRQPSTQPSSSPSTQPSMLPSSQPSSAPSISDAVWPVIVDRVDDPYAISNTISKAQLWQLMDYCNDALWAVSRPSGNCTIRLALAVCIYRFPWVRDLGKFRRSQECVIKVPSRSTITFGYSFEIGIIPHLRALVASHARFGALNITIDFGNSTFVMSNSFGTALQTVPQLLSLTLRGVNFVSLSPSFNSNGTLIQSSVSLTNLHSVELSSCSFESTALVVKNASSLYMYDSMMTNFSAYLLGPSAKRVKLMASKGVPIQYDFLRRPVPGALLGHALEVRDVSFVHISRSQWAHNIGNYLGAAVSILNARQVVSKFGY